MSVIDDEVKWMAALGFSHVSDIRYENGNIVVRMQGVTEAPWSAWLVPPDIYLCDFRGQQRWFDGPVGCAEAALIYWGRQA